jgi:hypothetical protein
LVRRSNKRRSLYLSRRSVADEASAQQIWRSLSMAVAERGSDRVLNPLDLIEHLAQGHDWPLERASDEELTLIVAGTWADYHISINWRDDLEALHLACAFDFRVPENRLPETAATRAWTPVATKIAT